MTEEQEKEEKQKYEAGKMGFVHFNIKTLFLGPDCF